MYSLEGISKTFAGRHALNHLDLDIRRGDTTVVIGPSGCGKSTLLRMLIGLVEPDEGRLSFDGKAIDRMSLEALRRRVGYVIQQGGLFPHLTAFQNVTLVSGHLGWSVERQRLRVAELTRLVQLPTDALDRYPGELSGGQNQRVSLMRALMLDPEVLLLDEPLGALDPIIRYELQEDLRRIFRSLRKTVVLVTHDLAEAAFFADLIVLMRRGSIVQQGSLRDLAGRPADEFVSRFVRAQRSQLDAIGERA